MFAYFLEIERNPKMKHTERPNHQQFIFRMVLKSIISI